MKTVSRAGSDLQYFEDDIRLPWQHDGASVVFHHGVGACADAWRGWLPTLLARHRTVRFDMRGHGQSACPDGFEWSITSMIGDLEAVIDASTTGPVHLVGESIGGTVALAFAMTYPSRVRTLTICNGAHAGASVRNLDDWAELMGKGGMIAWSAMMMERRFHRGSIPRAAWEWFETQQATANPTAIMDAVKVLVGTDLSADFGRLTMPTLLMHPDASPFIPVSLMAEMRDLLPDARLQVFAHARHGLPFSHAEACASLLSSFLAEAS